MKYTFNPELLQFVPVPKAGLMYRISLSFLILLAGLSFFVAYTWPKHSPFKQKQSITTDSVQVNGTFHKEKKFTK
tara:strand:- start:28 stop:252 length:225 start_codon:yes stop_codon:yes gene_type:complete